MFTLLDSSQLKTFLMLYNPVRLRLFSFSMLGVQCRAGGLVFFLFHQKLFNHFQENARGKKCIALLVLTELADLSDSFYASLSDETS